MWFLQNNLPPGYQHRGSVFLVDPPHICNEIVAVPLPPFKVGDADKVGPIVVPQTAILEKPKDLLLVMTVEGLDMLPVSAPHHV